MVLAGGNGVAVDLACAHLMGFDYRRLPVLFDAMAEHALPIAPANLEEAEWSGGGLGFRPHFGWRGHIEVNRL